MAISKKIVALSLAGMLAISGTVGIGTYALFSAKTADTHNAFTAGKLSIVSERDDIPMAGPMFYTSSTLGGTPTGLWTPGDKNTRGLFLENTGSLSAKLSTLTASLADSSGNIVSIGDGDAYTNDIAFAKQAHVLIWQVKMYDPANSKYIKWTDESATQINDYMTYLNDLFEAYQTNNPNADFNNEQVLAAFLATANKDLLSSINNLKATDGTVINNAKLQVVQLSYKSLADLVNKPSDVSANIVVAPNESALLAFTVTMDLKPTDVDANSMQGKSVYFNFGTEWTQATH